MKVLFVYPRFSRHAQHHPELLDVVPMNEYLGSPSLGIACLAAVTPDDWEIEYRDDRLAPADYPTDADVVALSFFTPAASRALELADTFRAMGRTVVAGGIFPTLAPDVVAPHVDAVIEGEGEAVWPRVLADAIAGTLAPRYSGQVDLEHLPIPRLSLYFGAECDSFRPDDYPVQPTRGCPLTCDACALPTSMGHRSRALPEAQVLAQLAQLSSTGRRACLTEDTGWFPGAAQRRTRSLLERVAEVGGAPISYIGISMPMILACPDSLLELARRAGVSMFYLVGGFDPITTRAFTGTDPTALERAERAIRRCFEHGIEPYTSFLLGNEGDDEGTVDRMLDFARRVGIRKAEFAILTPYPGTPSWRRLESQGRILHRDWSRYNDANAVFRPAQLTPDQLTAGYLRLWREFYADNAHVGGMTAAERTIQF